MRSSQSSPFKPYCPPYENRDSHFIEAHPAPYQYHCHKKRQCLHNVHHAQLLYFRNPNSFLKSNFPISSISRRSAMLF